MLNLNAIKARLDEARANGGDVTDDLEVLLEYVQRVAPATMDFSDALRRMKAGSTVRRRSWSRQVLYASNGEQGPYLQHQRTDGLVYSDPWRPSTSDMWAEDWEQV